MKIAKHTPDELQLKHNPIHLPIGGLIILIGTLIFSFFTLPTSHIECKKKSPTSSYADCTVTEQWLGIPYSSKETQKVMGLEVKDFPSWGALTFEAFAFVRLTDTKMAARVHQTVTDAKYLFKKWISQKTEASFTLTTKRKSRGELLLYLIAGLLLLFIQPSKSIIFNKKKGTVSTTSRILVFKRSKSIPLDQIQAVHSRKTTSSDGNNLYTLELELPNDEMVPLVDGTIDESVTIRGEAAIEEFLQLPPKTHQRW
ncbi:MAG: hypothetical protein CL920_25975 [Deltaproteobacteria bacterium]|nr:hypothetical protein [Deltaproteobacteria bacterium]|tara:strand:+ start:5735 stop:6502 length:768 start_codon:yes stop_codon:yes gene_type:complete